MIEVIDKGDHIFVIRIVMKEVHSLDIPNLKEDILDAISENRIKKLVIDLGEVFSITSSGIGVFVKIHQSLASELRLAAVNEQVKKVLEITKVNSVLKIFSTVDEAIASFDTR